MSSSLLPQPGGLEARGSALEMEMSRGHEHTIVSMAPAFLPSLVRGSKASWNISDIVVKLLGPEVGEVCLCGLSFPSVRRRPYAPDLRGVL